MPKESGLSEETAAQIVQRIQLRGQISGAELLQIAQRCGVKKPYIRLIIEGIEARGWLLYMEEMPGKKCKYGILDFHEGKKRCLAM